VKEILAGVATGSAANLAVMSEATKFFDSFGAGCKPILASAHLAGVIAAHMLVISGN